MEESVRLCPVVVNTGDGGQDGLLVFVTEKLVAVLVHLEQANGAGPLHDGTWFLEAGFGPCQVWNKGQIFATQDEAIDWIMDRVLADESDASLG